GDVFSLDDGEDEFDVGIGSMAVENGETELTFANGGNQFRSIFGGHDADDDAAEGEFILEGNSDEAADGEPESVGDEAGDVVGVLEDLADGEKPDDRLDESDGRSEVFETFGDEDDAEGA